MFYYLLLLFLGAVLQGILCQFPLCAIQSVLCSQWANHNWYKWHLFNFHSWTSSFFSRLKLPSPLLFVFSGVKQARWAIDNYFLVRDDNYYYISFNFRTLYNVTTRPIILAQGLIYSVFLRIWDFPNRVIFFSSCIYY